MKTPLKNAAMSATGAAWQEQFERYGPAYRWLVTVTGLCGTISMVLSSTIVNVVIPSVMGAYGVEQGQAQWVATAFIATMVASQLLNAWMVEAFGIRLAYCLILAVFTAGALICAASPTLEILIVGRIMQGFSAGVIMPLVMSTIISVFPENRRGFAIGLFGMGTTLAPGLGPFIGGLTIDSLTWRHLFIVPLPFVCFAFVLGMFLMPHRKFTFRLPSFDWTGYSLLIVALVCITASIGNGQRWGWGSNEILLIFTVGILSAILFVFTQLRIKSPLLDPTLFLNPRFAAVTMIAFVFGAGNFATNYAIPVFTQTVQGFTPTEAGLVLIPAGVALVVLMPTAGRLADVVPNHIPIMCGVVVFSTAIYFMAGADVNTAFWTIAGLTVLSRVGFSFVNPNMARVATGAVPADKLNRSVGTYNFMRQLGGAFGVNTIVVIMETRTAFHSEALTVTQTADNPTSREFLDKVEAILNQSGVPEAVQHSGALNYLGKVIHAQAFTLGFQDAFLIISFIFMCALLPALLLRRAGTKNPPAKFSKLKTASTG
ncbi:MAG: DHA2 family efflux MFS transporter permease subunit [Rhodospirillales bacterium]